MIRLARDLVLVLIVLAGAVGGSQVPRFTQEYVQRLGGAQQEAGRQLMQFETLAGGQNLAFEAYLDRLRRNGDLAVRGTGAVIADLRRHLNDLDEEARRLRAASWLARPVVMLAHGNSDLLRGTWQNFHFSFTLDPAFGVIGVALAYLARLGIGTLGMRSWRKVRAQRQT